MTRRIHKSEAQANAEALTRRSAPYSETHAASMAFSWDYRQHVPDDLRGMVRAARRAYEDEVPTKLHEGPDNIGEGGTPKMAATFVRYMDQPGASDAERGDQPLTSHYLTPFRAQMQRMMNGGLRQARRARIVHHITVGSQEPTLAAIAEGAHLFDAGLAAEDALRVFLSQMSDLKVHLAKEAVEAA